MNVNFTESAANQAKVIIANEDPGLQLRVYVQGGGCSGFQYVWDVTDEDPTVENLVVDPVAEMFVLGCTVDYVNELGGSYLKVINPNATASCGCGESFAV
jgi:iron-sulfur cluster insertion protein